MRVLGVVLLLLAVAARASLLDPNPSITLTTTLQKDKVLRVTLGDFQIQITEDRFACLESSKQLAEKFIPRNEKFKVGQAISFPIQFITHSARETIFDTDFHRELENVEVHLDNLVTLRIGMSYATLKPYLQETVLTSYDGAENPALQLGSDKYRFLYDGEAAAKHFFDTLSVCLYPEIGCKSVPLFLAFGTIPSGTKSLNLEKYVKDPALRYDSTGWKDNRAAYVKDLSADNLFVNAYYDFLPLNDGTNTFIVKNRFEKVLGELAFSATVSVRFPTDTPSTQSDILKSCASESSCETSVLKFQRLQNNDLRATVCGVEYAFSVPLNIWKTFSVSVSEDGRFIGFYEDNRPVHVQILATDAPPCEFEASMFTVASTQSSDTHLQYAIVNRPLPYTKQIRFYEGIIESDGLVSEERLATHLQNIAGLYLQASLTRINERSLQLKLMEVGGITTVVLQSANVQSSLTQYGSTELQLSGFQLTRINLFQLDLNIRRLKACDGSTKHCIEDGVLRNVSSVLVNRRNVVPDYSNDRSFAVDESFLGGWGTNRDSMLSFFVRTTPDVGGQNIDLTVHLPLAEDVDGEYVPLFLRVSNATLQFDRNNKKIFSSFLPETTMLHIQVTIKDGEATFRVNDNKKYVYSFGRLRALTGINFTSSVLNFRDGVREVFNVEILTHLDESCYCRVESNPIGFYGDSGKSCGNNATTRFPGAISASECVCMEGYRDTGEKDAFGVVICDEEGAERETGRDDERSIFLGYCGSGAQCSKTLNITYDEETGAACSCADDCFDYETNNAPPCCRNKCSRCAPNSTSPYYERCKCVWDYATATPRNAGVNASSLLCEGWMCGPGQQLSLGRCEPCPDNMYKPGANVNKCVPCEKCPDGETRVGCTGASRGICRKCQTCALGSTQIEACSDFQDTRCVRNLCTVPAGTCAANQFYRGCESDFVQGVTEECSACSYINPADCGEGFFLNTLCDGTQSRDNFCDSCNNYICRENGKTLQKGDCGDTSNPNSTMIRGNIVCSEVCNNFQEGLFTEKLCSSQISF